MGYYRGVSEAESRQARLEREAAAMRQRYLTTGKGCRTRAKAIAARQKAKS